MSPKLTREPLASASDSESSSLSSAPDDEDFDFGTAKSVPSIATSTIITRSTLAKRAYSTNHASNGRGRKGPVIQDSPAAKRPRRQAGKHRCNSTADVGADGDVTGGSSEKPQKCEESPGNVKIELLEASEEESKSGALPRPNRTSVVRKVSSKIEEGQDEGVEDPPKKLKRKRRTKEEKEAEAMPLAVRTAGVKMLIGAHQVNVTEGELSPLREHQDTVTNRFFEIGVQNAVTNCMHIGGNSFALFLKSQRKWESPAITPEHRKQFKALVKENNFDAQSHIVPHGSYLVNLAQDNAAKASQAYECFLDDLRRSESLGIKLYNFHPGSTLGRPRSEAIARVADNLNRAHRATSFVKTLLENMAGGGNVVGSTFEDLRDIIALIDDKSRVGVCLDTCHAFAAGYDLRTLTAFSSTICTFSDTIGLSYLSALHLNDSKAPFNSHRDLHQNIGLGFLGLSSFRNVMNEPAFEGLPMILETPLGDKGTEVEIWAREIKLLESLIGVSPNDPDFLAKEKELADQGAEERKKYQEMYDRKVEKLQKAAVKGKRKKRAKEETETETESNG
ncbi:MAG: hypothetical protein M1839_001402 [Geoglossum umbratile]|nr:MAG: hypothetical protein M1839_001402 [Geoglossum umbratile]